MDLDLDEVFPIMDVEHDCIISRNGDLSLAFKVTYPEIFTMSDENYEYIHKAFVKAVKVLQIGTIIHKQDWYLKKLYSVSDAKAGFLEKSSARHFNGRSYLQHEGYIILTRKVSGKSVGTSLTSNLFRSTIVPVESLHSESLNTLKDSAGQFQQILSESGIHLAMMKKEELVSTSKRAGLIEKYCTLNDDESKLVIKDWTFKPQLMIGDQYCQMYTLADLNDLPASCSPRINYEKYSTDNTKFSIGFSSPLGLLLNCNHIYSQYIFIEDPVQTLKKMESKRLRLQSLAAYSRQNKIAHDAVSEFLTEAVSQQRMIVKAHFNVLLWDENKEILKDARNLLTGGLAQIDAAAKLETVSAPQIFWAGIPGNAANFPETDTYDSFAEQACCFLNVESNYKSDDERGGIRFCDRLSSKPLFVDLYDKPRRLGITSNMGTLVCGTSGGGKSMMVNHMLHTMYQQHAHCVVVDIGGSYKGLCALVGGYYFTYEERNPIRFNPFFLPQGQGLDTEKKESLKSLLVALWKQEKEQINRSEYVALSNALQGYYKKLEKQPEIFPCFNSFYEYLRDYYTLELEQYSIKDRDFDVYNFLYVLQPYYEGGEFDYLLNATTQLDLLNQAFVVIEMDNIKDHPILFPVIVLIIMEMFISKIRRLADRRKVLAIDEAWKAIAKSGMAEFIKYAFKTIRKFNGIPIVITQEIDDLVSSPVIKDAIINNADIKILMDMRKYVNKFDRLQEVLGLSAKAKEILLSVNKDIREIFLDIGGVISKVLRNELCPQEYYAYTTDGKERVKVAEFAERYGSYEEGIRQLVSTLKK
ncbi:MAG: TraG family conjugative transposon ATPase [Agriterribacter sp.]